MRKPHVQPTGRESPFGVEELIVSKTDLKGRITYANDIFVRVSHFSLKELMGAPHSVIRHPDMPRSVFKLLWDTIEAKKEIFAYVINLAKNGDHYWVFAHVTPGFDMSGNIVGYHSNRRKPDAAQVQKVQPLYGQLAEIERRHENPKEGMAAALAHFTGFLKTQGMDYDEFIFSV
ncbi:MAG: PAS domain-containing protein [Alphaproteobacteria bacterium]